MGTLLQDVLLVGISIILTDDHLYNMLIQKS